MVALMSTLKGIVAAVWLALNTLTLGTGLTAVAAFRALTPAGQRHDALSAFMDRFIDRWVRNNRAVFGWLGIASVYVHWQDEPLTGRDCWYLVVANHQTWSDILVLQDALVGRIPPLKFFVKRELLWLPMAGHCMWLLDFPFLRRFGA
jgi:1-acyl-sn-glycerol-3-phosphate acyltransferase